MQKQFLDVELLTLVSDLDALTTRPPTYARALLPQDRCGQTSNLAYKA